MSRSARNKSRDASGAAHASPRADRVDRRVEGLRANAVVVASAHARTRESLGERRDGFARERSHRRASRRRGDDDQRRRARCAGVAFSAANASTHSGIQSRGDAHAPTNRAAVTTRSAVSRSSSETAATHVEMMEARRGVAASRAKANVVPRRRAPRVALRTPSTRASRRAPRGGWCPPAREPIGAPRGGARHRTAGEGPRGPRGSRRRRRRRRR